MTGQEVQVATDAAGVLIERGVMGLVILALAFVTWRLFSLLMKSWEQRVEEKAVVVAALNANTAGLNAITEWAKGRRDGTAPGS